MRLLSKYNVVVVGSTSKIAQLLAPYIRDVFSQIIVVNHRLISNHEISFFPNALNLIVDFSRPNLAYEKIVGEVLDKLNGPTILMNFTGVLGPVSDFTEIDIEKTLSIVNENLGPFFVLTKFASLLEKESAYVGFSGAGVGGNSLDLSSVGYAAAKGSTGVLIDAINLELKKSEKFAFLIAPGAFPSKMQRAILDNPKQRSENTIAFEQALETLSKEPNVTKLISLLDYLLKNLSLAGGKVFSAKWDNLEEISNNDDLGKIRRIN
jgi:NAD(P)-dependent dehydrogenase (short-subunit alcohol dehydrogenase family)